VVLGILVRTLLERGDLLDRRMHDLTEREHLVERDVVIEQERNRVARDVHDVVAHSLAVVIAQADGARYAAEKDPATVSPALDAIAETARVALGEVRTLLHELRHTQSATPSPGTGDLDTLIEGFRVLGLTVDVAHYGHQRALGDATQLAVYRVVQESLTNALRHGDTAQPVSVDFDWGDHALAVVITNALQGDGVPQVDGPGHGIPGMRERAALAGGDFTVGVGTRGMFRVRASLPASTSPDAPTVVLARG
jgi:signal transduction histidine kinase